jgi:hypothetical protein
LLILTHGVLGAAYRYSYVPKTVYTTQVFPVTILARDGDAARPVTFAFDAAAQPLNTTPAKVINGRDLFYTFYFLASGEDDFALPPLKIREENATHTLPSRSIHTDTLETASATNFCGLIAIDCTIKASQISTFDANSTLVSLTLEAHEANPEAIRIPGSLEEGLEKVTRNQSTVTAEYYFVIPSTQTRITLSYYNTIEHRFVPTTIATDYRNKPVAAQVELNPKVSPFDRLKKYGSIALALFFALMFAWRRDGLYLVLMVLMATLIYAAYKPRETLCVQEGALLYVLPTENSRSSTTLSEEIHAASLGTHGDYLKINYRHGIIGWIRHEDLCHD